MPSRSAGRPWATTIWTQTVDLSPGDRVHYRIDYGNPGPEDVTGVTLRDELDTAYVASVEAITGEGTTVSDPIAGISALAIQWNTGHWRPEPAVS